MNNRTTINNQMGYGTFEKVYACKVILITKYQISQMKPINV